MYVCKGGRGGVGRRGKGRGRAEGGRGGRWEGRRGEGERGEKGKFGVADEAPLLFSCSVYTKPPHATSSILGMLSPNSARRRLLCVSFVQADSCVQLVSVRAPTQVHRMAFLNS